MKNHHSDQLKQIETTCASLLKDLQSIWDELGEPVIARDNVLLEIEHECVVAYERKVSQAKKSRAQLQQEIADFEAELVDICSAMGEAQVNLREFEENAGGSLKEKLKFIISKLEEMQELKCERKKKFIEVLDQLQNIAKELCKPLEDCNIVMGETDLSLKRLQELHRLLLELQDEKTNRLRQIFDHLKTLDSLCKVLGLDSKQTFVEIHPSMDDSIGSKNITSDTIDKLVTTVLSLQEVKTQRMHRLQDLAAAMLELWSLMDTPTKEQQIFQNVTSIIAASEDEVTEPNTLSLDFINRVEGEVSRLEHLKSIKMKELILKKRIELEEICSKIHVVSEVYSPTIERSFEAIESGNMEPTFLLEQVELQIARVKEEAISRKEILDKVVKWLAACDEECWLEEYSRDENRYSAGRGAHLHLKRAEKARVLISKIPAMTEALILKAKAWEDERGIEFLYDGVRFLSMLDQYNVLREEKEQDRQRQREQKRLQGQLIAEQEALFGSKPSPSQTGKKLPRISSIGAANRRLSHGGLMLLTPNPEKAAHHTRPSKKDTCVKQNNSLKHQQHSGSSVPPGSKNLDSAYKPAKTHFSKATTACEIESSVIRKPLSPISSIVVSDKNTSEQAAQDRTPKRTLQGTIPPSKTPTASPSKLIFVDDWRNKTPKNRPIPLPTTPSTCSHPMQAASTPATPCIPFAGNQAEDRDKVIECSFEERRAAFMLSEDYPGKHQNQEA